MKRNLKIIYIIAFFILPVSSFSAQTNGNSDSDQFIKWGTIRGYEDELVLFMPQVFEVIADDNYDKSKTNKIKKRLSFSQNINGVVLITDYYEGDSEKIQKSLQQKENLTLTRKVDLYGFEFSNLSGKIDDYFYRTQYFRIKNRLYIVKSVAKSKDNAIADFFFQSIILTNGNRKISPNFEKDISNLSFPKIIERMSVKVADNIVINLEEVNRKPINLYLSIPKVSINTRLKSPNGKVKLKVLYSSLGKITDIQVLESPSPLATEAAIEAAKKTRFIPAEKDGKLVSVYQFQEYNFVFR